MARSRFLNRVSIASTPTPTAAAPLSASTTASWKSPAVEPLRLCGPAKLRGSVVVAPIYAPALVAFMGGPHFSISVGIGGGELAAWFPLGPGEPFFPWYHCRETYIREVNITSIRNVTNITNIVNITNINEVHYAYRTAAATAVPANVFRSGQPVARQLVRLTPQQVARAQVIPHPTVTPTTRAALPGRPVAAPPVRAAQVISARSTAGPPAIRTAVCCRPLLQA